MISFKVRFIGVSQHRGSKTKTSFVGSHMTSDELQVFAEGILSLLVDI